MRRGLIDRSIRLLIVLVHHHIDRRGRADGDREGAVEGDRRVKGRLAVACPAGEAGPEVATRHGQVVRLSGIAWATHLPPVRHPRILQAPPVEASRLAASLEALSHRPRPPDWASRPTAPTVMTTRGPRRLVDMHTVRYGIPHRLVRALTVLRRVPGRKTNRSRPRPPVLRGARV
jgi:hypothetical protein